MSDVTHALSRLGQVVRTLEGSMEGLEAAMTGEQRDMFTAPPVANSNGLSEQDKERVSQKLDLAINKIEDILNEEAEGDLAHG